MPTRTSTKHLRGPADGAAGDLFYVDADMNLVRLPIGGVEGMALVRASGFPAWGAVGAAYGGGGGATVIDEVITSASQATLTFPTIPGGFKRIELHYQCRVTAAGAEEYVAIRFNGDAGANYYGYEQAVGVGASMVVVNSGAGVTSILVSNAPGAGSTAGYSASGILSIPSYDGTTFFKTTNHLGSWYASGGMKVSMNAGSWNSYAAIASATVYTGTGFVNGSKFTLLGIG